MPGFEGSQTPPCPSCQGKGYILNFAGPEPTRPCLTCKGTNKPPTVEERLACQEQTLKNNYAGLARIFNDLKREVAELTQSKDTLYSIVKRQRGDIESLEQQIKGRTYTPPDVLKKIKELESRLDGQATAHAWDEIAPFGPAEMVYCLARGPAKLPGGMQTMSVDELFGAMSLKRIGSLSKDAEAVLEGIRQANEQRREDEQMIGDALKGHPCILIEDRKLRAYERIAEILADCLAEEDLDDSWKQAAGIWLAELEADHA